MKKKSHKKQFIIACVLAFVLALVFLTAWSQLGNRLKAGLSTNSDWAGSCSIVGQTGITSDAACETAKDKLAESTCIKNVIAKCKKDGGSLTIFDAICSTKFFKVDATSNYYCSVPAPSPAATFVILPSDTVMPGMSPKPTTIVKPTTTVQPTTSPKVTKSPPPTITPTETPQYWTTPNPTPYKK